MRHARTGKKLGRDSAHRKALYSNLTCSLIEHGRIRTTEAKAKAVKPFAEQMITLGRRGDLHARRQALSVLRSQEMVHKLFDDVGPRMADRPGGYSRIVKLGHRAGDAAEMVYLELVDFEPSRARNWGTELRAPEIAISDALRAEGSLAPRACGTASSWPGRSCAFGAGAAARTSGLRGSPPTARLPLRPSLGDWPSCRLERPAGCRVPR